MEARERAPSSARCMRGLPATLPACLRLRARYRALRCVCARRAPWTVARAQVGSGNGLPRRSWRRRPRSRGARGRSPRPASRTTAACPAGRPTPAWRTPSPRTARGCGLARRTNRRRGGARTRGNRTPSPNSSRATTRRWRRRAPRWRRWTSLAITPATNGCGGTWRAFVGGTRASCRRVPPTNAAWSATTRPTRRMSTPGTQEAASAWSAPSARTR
jgi:hypothetical protein